MQPMQSKGKLPNIAQAAHAAYAKQRKTVKHYAAETKSELFACIPTSKGCLTTILDRL
jgi:hypothetical protein